MDEVKVVADEEFEALFSEGQWRPRD